MENKEEVKTEADHGMCHDGKCEGADCRGWMCGGMAHGDMCGGGCGCRCVHHMVKGTLIFIAGGSIAAAGLGYINADAATVIIGGVIAVFGLKKIFAGMCKCC